MFKKTLTILITFIAIFIFAKYSLAAEIKKTICASGCDYTVLETAMNANEQNLTDAGGDYFLAEIQDGSDDTTAVTVHNYTTLAANYVRIYTTAAARHPGKWDATKFELTVTNVTAINVNINFAYIEGLQISVPSNGSYDDGIVFQTITGAGAIYASYNIIRQVPTSGNDNSYGIYVGDAEFTAYIYNNAIYDFRLDGSTYGSYCIWTNVVGTAYLYNNTTYNCRNGIAITTGTNTAINNISNNTSNDGFVGTFTSSDYNASDRAADAPGANSRNGADGDLNFVAPTSGDFHLAAADSNAIDKGTADPGAGLFSDDIDGATRSGTWDIGADESGVAPEIASAADAPDPIGVGALLTFSVDWSDADGDNVSIHICKSSGITTSTATCKEGEWTTNGVQTNRDPETAAYTTAAGDAGAQNYWAFACDSAFCSAGAAGTFTVANQKPDAPTALLTENLQNPSNITDLTPEFSAVFQDSADEGDLADKYCIEVDTQSDFAGTDMWVTDSASCYTGTAIGSTVKVGARSPDFSYAGTALSAGGATYYWRAWFWDDGGDRSATSTTGIFKMANTTSGGGGVRLRAGRLKGDVRLR